MVPMLTSLSATVSKIAAASNIYIIKVRENKYMVVDTGPAKEKREIHSALLRCFSPAHITAVILTHLHYDHTGNLDLFPCARVYASAQAIKDFRKDPFGSVLREQEAKFLGNIILFPLPQAIGPLEVLPAPGHTAGSICLWYSQEKILFSGDTIFTSGYGRTDLPTGNAASLTTTLGKLRTIPYTLLCPGHDY
ncbi:hypothetical protein COY95_03645 [Candidatus Woesearchaeota archaeon CG_4_10_14_0_8_um_filter_47_5]|nr:MAG: hypothetical protein COY95_03645 [Candidatus Woesearchaeota archaeon CG_4_10_14_0_8_um_filter_47_5]